MAASVGSAMTGIHFSRPVTSGYAVNIMAVLFPKVDSDSRRAEDYPATNQAYRAAKYIMEKAAKRRPEQPIEGPSVLRLTPIPRRLSPVRGELG